MAFEDLPALVGDTALQFALFFNPKRRIALFAPDVAVEELHIDQMVITDHPVETGASISDHAFMLPPEVELRWGWSNSSSQNQNWTQIIYRSLLFLQASRIPFFIVTGKRVYTDMMLRGLTVTTDPATENVLMVIASCKKVIIVDTKGQNAPSKDAQQQPQQTSPVENGGTKFGQPYTHLSGAAVS